MFKDILQNLKQTHPVSVMVDVQPAFSIDLAAVGNGVAEIMLFIAQHPQEIRLQPGETDTHAASTAAKFAAEIFRA